FLFSSYPLACNPLSSTLVWALYFYIKKLPHKWSNQTLVEPLFRQHSLVDGDVHGGAVLGVEGEHPGAGCGARLLRKPRGLPLQAGAKHDPAVCGEIAD